MIYLTIIFVILILFIFYNIYINYKNKFFDSFINFKQKLDTAVIVEPRTDITLIKVLYNFIELLPKYTVIQIFHGTNNKHFIQKYFHNYINSGKIILTNLNKENLTIKEYNLLLTSKEFYNKIKGENILIFQMDTCLCSNSKYKIEDFLIYDYVGAPWIDSKHKNKIGNGGLSLRKKSKMLEHINKYKYSLKINEDVYFSRSDILNFPDIKTASFFSTEHLFNPYSVGLHQPEKVLNNYNKKILRRTCPEYIKVFE